MPSLEDIIRILNDGPLSFKFAILIGIVLIIIAVVPSLSIPILKTPAITLTRNQSIVLAGIGGVIIVGGLAGIVVLENTAPVVNGLQIFPQPPIIAYKAGTPIRISIDAKDEGVNNKILNIFNGEKLQFQSYLLNPDTKIINHKYGPSTESNFTITIFPRDIGYNEIVINVNDGKNELNFSKDYIICSPSDASNQPPKIEDLSITQPNKALWIRANAIDPENDKLFYYFYQHAIPSDEEPIEILPSWKGDYNQKARYWTPTDGEYLITVFVIDGDKKGPWIEHENVSESALIDINGKKLAQKFVED